VFQKMSVPLRLPLMASINSSIISVTVAEYINQRPTLLLKEISGKENGSYTAILGNNSVSENDCVE